MGKRSRDSGLAQTEVKIEVVDGQDAGKEGPFVMYYPSGFDPLEHEKNYKLSAFRKGKQQMELVGETETVDFVGVNYAGECTGQQTSKFVLGVYDEEAGTMKLLPLGGTKVFRMTPRVRGLSYEAPEYVPVPDGETREDMMSRANSLAKSFGRENLQKKREERKIGRIEEKHMSAKNMVQTDLIESTKAEVGSDVVFSRASELRNIPPFDKQATTPEEAFPLDLVVTRPEQAALKELIGRLGRNSIDDLKESGRIQPLVLHYLEELKQIGKPGKRPLTCLAYLNCLLAIYKGPFRIQDKHLKEMALPEGLAVTVLLKFADESVAVAAEANDISDHKPAEDAEDRDRPMSYQRTPAKKDLLMCYILVLCLMVKDYAVETAFLLAEFKITQKQLSLYFSELGCATSKVRASEEDENAPKKMRARLLVKTGKTLGDLLPERRPRPKAAGKR